MSVLVLVCQCSCELIVHMIAAVIVNLTLLMYFKALYHTAPFRMAVYSMPIKETDGTKSIPLALQKLFYKASSLSFFFFLSLYCICL
jgi:hypothetical protein